MPEHIAPFASLSVQDPSTGSNPVPMASADFEVLYTNAIDGTLTVALNLKTWVGLEVHRAPLPCWVCVLGAETVTSDGEVKSVGGVPVPTATSSGFVQTWGAVKRLRFSRAEKNES